LQVAAAVEQAWRAFRAETWRRRSACWGRCRTRKCLSCHPARTGVTRWRKGMVVLIGVLMMVSCLFSLLANKHDEASPVRPAAVTAGLHRSAELGAATGPGVRAGPEGVGAAAVVGVEDLVHDAGGAAGGFTGAGTRGDAAEGVGDV